VLSKRVRQRKRKKAAGRAEGKTGGGAEKKYFPNAPGAEGGTKNDGGEKRKVSEKKG